MKFFLFAVICSLLAASNAHVFDGFFKDSEYPGKCVREGIALAVGEEKQPEGKCERFLCLKEDGWGRVLICDSQIFDPACKLGDRIQPSAEFPFCCGRHVVCN